MSQPQPRIEVAAIDSFVLRLFERIDEANMPWLLAAEENLRAAFGAALLDLVPSYTTLLLQYDLLQLDPGVMGYSPSSSAPAEKNHGIRKDLAP